MRPSWSHGSMIPRDWCSIHYSVSLAMVTRWFTGLVYVCVYVFVIYVCICDYVCICVFVMCVYTHVYGYITYVCMFVCICKFLCVCVCTVYCVYRQCHLPISVNISSTCGPNTCVYCPRGYSQTACTAGVLCTGGGCGWTARSPPVS